MPQVTAVFEGGVLRPLSPLALREHQQVIISIVDGPEQGADDWFDAEFTAACRAEADPTVSLETVRQALSKIPGRLADDVRAERDER